MGLQSMHLFTKTTNSHAINITRAHSPKTMRQRNTAESIVPTMEGNVCIEYVTMVKRRTSILVWGAFSYFNALHKAHLKGVLNLNTHICSVIN